MVPHLFWKTKIPRRLPKGMQEVIDRLKKSKNKEDCLRKAYDVLSKKYTGCSVYVRIPYLFIVDLNKLWSIDGGLHCTNLSYLLRVLLVKSGFFKEEDIKLKLAFIGYVSIHQYLSIRLDNDKFVNVDVWGHFHGIRLGDYAHGFHYSTFRKIAKKLKNLFHY